MDWESLSTTEHDPLALAHASPEPQMILTQTGPILGHLTKNPVIRRVQERSRGGYCQGGSSSSR